MSMQRNQKGQFVKGANGHTFEGFGIWLDCKGYPCIWLNGKNIRIHVLLWERVNGSKPKGYEIHHRDFDRDHYSLDNLELLTISDHRKYHAGWIKKDGVWVSKPCTRCKKVLSLNNFYQRKGHTPSALCKPCTNIVTTAKNKTIPGKRRLYNQRWYAKRKGVMPNA